MESTSSQVLIVSCDSQCLHRIREFVRRKATEAGFSREDVGQLVLAADEASSNIIKHTYHFDPNRKLEILWQESPDRAVLEIKDDHPVPCLPSHSDFDLSTKVKFRHSSGYGKYLMRTLVDDLLYETIPGSHNKVSLIKFRKDRSLEEQKETKETSPSHVGHHPDSVKIHQWLELFESLGKQKTTGELIKLFLNGVVGLLTTHPIALLATKEEGGAFHLMGHVGLSKRLSSQDAVLPRHGWIMETLWAFRGPLLADEFRKRKVPQEELRILENLHSTVLIPLFLNDRLRAVISLGAKRNQKPFTEEDVRIVTLLAGHVFLLCDVGSVMEGTEEVIGAVAPVSEALSWALIELSQIFRDETVAVSLEEDAALPSLKMDTENLQKIILLLLTHIHYLTQEGSSITVKALSHDHDKDKEGQIIIEYVGTPLVLEKGHAGYNPLIDQLTSTGHRLPECRRLVESFGGRLEVCVGSEDSGGQGKQVSVILSLPFEGNVSESLTKENIL